MPESLLQPWEFLGWFLEPQSKGQETELEENRAWNSWEGLRGRAGARGNACIRPTGAARVGALLQSSVRLPCGYSLFPGHRAGKLCPRAYVWGDTSSSLLAPPPWV